MLGRFSGGRNALPLALWALLRVPALLLCAVLLSGWIITYVIDPIYFTHFIISILSTPFARVLLFLIFTIVYLALWQGTRKLSEPYGYWLMLALAAVGLIVLFRITGTPQRFAPAIVLLLATNLLPDRLFEQLPDRLRRFGMSVLPGVGEFFFTHRYISWVAELWTGRRFAVSNELLRVLPSIIVVAGLTAVLVRSPQLVDVEHALRLPSSVRIIARGDFNWIELDASKEHLFVGGHGVPNLLRYDVRNLERPPLTSPVDAGAPQGFTYEPVAGEVYVYNPRTKALLVLDSKELTLKRTVPIRDLASGDSWIVVHGETNTITIVSEADESDGKPFIVLDRSTGAVRDRRDIDAGNVLLDPQGARLFLSFFRRSNRLMVYDLSKLSITADVAAPHYIDRMALVPASRDLLLVAPAKSRVARFDADTLAPRGEIKAMFGVRSIAVDETRKLLLCGSLATGELFVMDMESLAIRSRIYLGPWLRTIQVDSSRGVAYISSNGFLYEYSYAAAR